MMSKRILTIALALIFILSIAACGTSETTTTATTTAAPDGTTTEGTATESETEAPGEDGPLTPYDEEITMTWAVSTSAVQQFIGSDTYEDNAWSRKIKEELNINLVVAFSADGSTDAYGNMLNTRLASGDLPDIFTSGDMNFFNQATESGDVADISDIFDQYATASVKEYQTRYVDSFDGVTRDDKLYGIPSMNDNFHNAAVLWIRDDWLENLDREAPTTIDELIDLARAFTFDDPNGSGADDTFGLGLNKNLVNMGFATIQGFIGAYGVPGNAHTVFYRDDAGEMTYSYLEPGMKEALTVLAEMYEEGLVDKEFVVKDNAVQEEDIASGKIGMAFGSNWGTWYPYNYIYQSDGVITRPYPIPTQDGYSPKVGIHSNASGQVTMLNSNAANPEAFIKILNLYDDVVHLSEDPQNFQTFWADEQYRLCPVIIRIPNEVYAPDLLEAFELGTSESLFPAAKPFYDYVVGFEDGSLTDPNAYGTWGQMSAHGSLPIMLDYVEKGMVVQSIMGANRPDIWYQNASILETITITAFTDIITGVKSPDAFDQYVSDWLNAGGQQVLDDLDEMYSAN